MLATDNFVFIHTHKTGGQFVAGILRELYPDLIKIGYHYPRALIPAEHRDKPVLGFVRNPWDWYVSWYHFNQARVGMNPMFGLLSDNWRLSFDATVTRLVNLSEKSAEAGLLRDKIAACMPEYIYGNRASGLTKSCLASMLDSQKGYVTWLYERMLGLDKPEGLYIGKQETLADDLRHMLSIVSNATFSSEQLNAALQAPPCNVSPHSDYRDYYSDTLRELVAKKDSPIIAQFQYTFSQAAGAEPVQANVF